MDRFGTFLQIICLAFLCSSACEARGAVQSDLAGEKQGTQPAGGIAWFHDLFEAHKVAVATGRPLLIVFGADWCHYCKEMEKTTLQNPKLASYVSANFVPVHLDTDRDKRIAEILKVKPIPCTVVLSPKADMLVKIVGYREMSPYYAELEKSRLRYVKTQRHK
jgi:thioredoxin-related protein